MVRLSSVRADKDPVSFLLAAPTTDHMNAVSPYHIISMYPDLTYDNQAIRVPGVLSSDNQLSSGTVLHDTNAHMRESCGMYCPLRWRILYRDHSIYRRQWFVDDDTKTIAAGWAGQQWEDKFLLRNTMSRWRLSDVCHNPMCTRRVAQDRLMEHGVY